MKKLSDGEIQTHLSQVHDWAEVGEAIQKTFQFPNFVESMRFVDKVAAAAERDQHHPDILIRYNKVTLTLATHDAGGITEKDFALARTADALMGPPPAPIPKGRKGKA